MPRSAISAMGCLKLVLSKSVIVAAAPLFHEIDQWRSILKHVGPTQSPPLGPPSAPSFYTTMPKHRLIN